MTSAIIQRQRAPRGAFQHQKLFEAVWPAARRGIHLDHSASGC